MNERSATAFRKQQGFRSLALIQIVQFGGVVLDDDPEMVQAHAAEAVPGGAPDGADPSGDICHLRLTLLQGKYHQVKRMVAAVGNRVEGLHRSRIGRLELPDDLQPGQWRWVEDPAVVLP